MAGQIATPHDFDIMMSLRRFSKVTFMHQRNLEEREKNELSRNQEKSLF
jgi:hypothetical protein